MKSVRSCVGTLVVLILCRVGEIAEACSCSPVHPQQAFCNADIGKCVSTFFKGSYVTMRNL